VKLLLINNIAAVIKNRGVEKKLKEILFSESISTAVLNFGIYVAAFKLLDSVDVFVVGWALSSIVIATLASVYINLARFKVGVELTISSLLVFGVAFAFSIHSDISLVFMLYGFSQAVKKILYFNGCGKLHIYVSLFNYVSLICFILLVLVNVDVYLSLLVVSILGICFMLGLRLYAELFILKPEVQVRKGFLSPLIIGLNSLVVSFYLQGQVLIANYLLWPSEVIEQISILMVSINLILVFATHEVNTRYLYFLQLANRREIECLKFSLKYLVLFILLTPFVLILWIFLSSAISGLDVTNFILCLLFCFVYIYYLDSNLYYRLTERYGVPLMINAFSLLVMILIYYLLFTFQLTVLIAPLSAVTMAFFISNFIKYYYVSHE
jgi:hypothetical protein